MGATQSGNCEAEARNPNRGAPGGTRTPNLLVRSQPLYPIELRAREGAANPTRRLHRGVGWSIEGDPRAWDRPMTLG